jgi:molecular chaperone DnaK (HSP70)
LIDANGILTVSARDLRTGHEHSIEVKPSYGLTDEQIEKMLLDSFEFAEEDIYRRQLIEARNEAETVMRATQKAVQEHAQELIADDERRAISAALDDLRKVVGGDDQQLIRERTKALDDASRHLAEIIMDSALVSALKDRKASEVAEG